MVMICDYPQACEQVVYASYEVGAGNSVSNHVKFTCRKADGSVSTYITWVPNGWGLIGLNRVGSGGTQIDFRRGNSDRMSCK